MRIDNDILIPELARLLNDGKEVRFTPSGVSMRPFIEGDRDSVILAPLTQDPKVGDILLAHALMPDKSTAYVLHRLVRITQSPNPLVPSSSNPLIPSSSNPLIPSSTHPLYILQGDGNLSGEESCRREDILGRVTSIERPSSTNPLTPSSTNPSRLYARLWYYLRPFRPFLLKIYRRLAVSKLSANLN